MTTPPATAGGQPATLSHRLRSRTQVLGGVSGMQIGDDQGQLLTMMAARRAGMSGPPPRDIDVLVVGDTPQRDLYTLGKAAGDELGQEVNITRVDPAAWLAQTDSFVKTVRPRPMTAIPVHQDSEE